MVINIILILGVFEDDVELALRKVSLTVLIQSEFAVFGLAYFVGVLPWEKCDESIEYYYIDVSKPNVNGLLNEMF
jgi:hypothetical protein